jgi:hypothetical protein
VLLQDCLNFFDTSDRPFHVPIVSVLFHLC